MNLACAKTKSHCPCFSPLKLLNKFPRFWLTTLVFPSGYEWYVELYNNLEPIFLQNNIQKCLRNLVSLSELILRSSTCNATIYQKNKTTTLVATLVFLHGMKCFVFKKLSTTRIIKSWPFFCSRKSKNKVHTYIVLRPP